MLCFVLAGPHQDWCLPHSHHAPSEVHRGEGKTARLNSFIDWTWRRSQSTYFKNCPGGDGCGMWDWHTLSVLCPRRCKTSKIRDPHCEKSGNYRSVWAYCCFSLLVEMFLQMEWNLFWCGTRRRPSDFCILLECLSIYPARESKCICKSWICVPISALSGLDGMTMIVLIEVVNLGRFYCNTLILILLAVWEK